MADASHESSVILAVAERLDIHPCDVWTPNDLGQLEEAIGGGVPSLFRAFVLEFGTPRSVALRFETDDFHFSRLGDMLETLKFYEIEGKRVIPFGYDLLGSVWLLRFSPQPGNDKVLFMPVQERYTNPEAPVETRATSFEAFLLALTRAENV